MQDLGKISFYNVKVRDSDGAPVNPATEEKQNCLKERMLKNAE